MYSKVKILGHPLHPMVVAYPIALYTATLVAYIIYAAHNDPFFFKVAVAANIAGIVLAAVAALPGFIDWAVGIPSDTAAKSHGLTHMLLNVGALVIFIINALIHTGNWDKPSGTTSGIILALVGVLLTVGAGYFGWTMIQTDHVGVELTPDQERLERGIRVS
jgi:uncharacterized membrane protein